MVKNSFVVLDDAVWNGEAFAYCDVRLALWLTWTEAQAIAKTIPGARVWCWDR